MTDQPRSKHYEHAARCLRIVRLRPPIEVSLLDGDYCAMIRMRVRLSGGRVCGIDVPVGFSEFLEDNTLRAINDAQHRLEAEVARLTREGL